MRNNINFRFCGEDEFSGELFVGFIYDKFAGVSSACVDLLKIKEFAEKISQFPISGDNIAVIAGGIYDRVSAQDIVQEHIYIAAYPVNSRGEVGLRVRLAVPSGNNELLECRFSASAEFICDYETLAFLSKNLTALALHEIDEFTVEI